MQQLVGTRIVNGTGNWGNEKLKITSFVDLRFTATTVISCVSVYILANRLQVEVSIINHEYSSTSLVRGFWDEIFWPSKPRTTEEPRTVRV